jgi:hypothetical protein
MLSDDGELSVTIFQSSMSAYFYFIFIVILLLLLSLVLYALALLPDYEDLMKLGALYSGQCLSLTMIWL